MIPPGGLFGEVGVAGAGPRSTDTGRVVVRRLPGDEHAAVQHAGVEVIAVAARWRRPPLVS